MIFIFVNYLSCSTTSFCDAILLLFLYLLLYFVSDKAINWKFVKIINILMANYLLLMLLDNRRYVVGLDSSKNIIRYI